MARCTALVERPRELDCEERVPARRSLDAYERRPRDSVAQLGLHDLVQGGEAQRLEVDSSYVRVRERPPHVDRRAASRRGRPHARRRCGAPRTRARAATVGRATGRRRRRRVRRHSRRGRGARCRTRWRRGAGRSPRHSRLPGAAQRRARGAAGPGADRGRRPRHPEQVGERGEGQACLGGARAARENMDSELARSLHRCAPDRRLADSGVALEKENRRLGLERSRGTPRRRRAPSPADHGS